MTAAAADLVVGIPSYNNARTVGSVVAAVEAGLGKYFPELKAVVVNSDGGSTDGTPEVIGRTVLDATTLLLRNPLTPAQRITTPYQGPPGKGSAIRTVLRQTVELGARACAVVDADLRSITPEWMELLLAPILTEGYDFVAPLYQRHKFDGTITNSIVYPLTRALYGKRLRQPIGGDFGISRGLAEHYLAQDVWDGDVARFGIDIWMTIEALTGGSKVCQSYLGAKIHDQKDPGADLSEMLVQVVGSLFDLAERHEQSWIQVTGSEEIPTFGFRYTVGLEEIRVDAGRMLNIFRGGLANLGDLWREILGAGDYGQLRILAGAPDGKFNLPDSLWSGIVYDYLLAYHRRLLAPDHLLKSLTPLYLGRTASFVMEASGLDHPGAEARTEALCAEFERRKEDFRRRWI